MTTITQIKAKGEALTRELKQIRNDITAQRRRLEAAAGNEAQAEQAGKIAGALLVLEAREKSTQAAIEANQSEQARRAELAASPAYTDAQQRIAAIEAELTREAAEIRQQFGALYDRVQADLQRHDELRALVSEYAVDMGTIEKSARLRSPAYGYLADISTMLTLRRKMEQRVDSLQAMTDAKVQAQRNPKPKAPPVIEKIKQTFYRYTDHRGAPELDAAGDPVG
jgi:phage host-nuclease inhibitor protein Gam